MQLFIIGTTVSLLIAVALTDAQWMQPMLSQPDPLAAMMDERVAASNNASPALEQRLRQLDTFYRVVRRGIAYEGDLGGGRRLVEMRLEGARPYLLLHCQEEREEESVADDFTLNVLGGRERQRRIRPTREQLAALQRCECSGEVIGEPGSIAEMTLCGQLSGFVLLSNGTYIAFESVYDHTQDIVSLLFTSTSDRRAPLQQSLDAVGRQEAGFSPPNNYFPPPYNHFPITIPPTEPPFNNYFPTTTTPPPPAYHNYFPTTTTPPITTRTPPHYQYPTEFDNEIATQDRGFGDDGTANEVLRVHLIADRSLVSVAGGAAQAMRIAMRSFRFTRRIYRRELCIRVRFAGGTVLRDEPFSSPNNAPFVFLDNFCSWAQRRSGFGRTNLVHLITGRGAIGPATGVAQFQAACRDYEGANPFGCGWSGYRQDQADVDATVAHEIAHNLAADHDNVGCECCDATGQCLMEAASFPPGVVVSHFSSCTKDQVSSYVHGGQGQCLQTSRSRRRCRIELAGPLCDARRGFDMFVQRSL